MWIDLPRIARMRDELRALLGDDDDDQTYLDTLTGETSADLIAEHLVEQMQEAASLAKAARERAQALAERARRLEARADAHRAQMKPLLDAMGLPKLVLPAATISIRPGGVSVEIDNPDEVPTQLCRIKREPDKAAIKAQLAAGETVPGARLVRGDDTISIRVS
jgi:hypothetical protein